MIADSIEVFLYFGLIGALTNWIAWKNNYFHLPVRPALPIALAQVLSVFAIYLGMILFAGPILLKLLELFADGRHIPVGMLTFLQILILGLIVVFLTIYGRSQNETLMKKIWKNTEGPQSKPVMFDIGLGILVWFISFPAVAVVGQFFDLLIYLFAGFESYEQVAVRYLRTNVAHPSMLAIALATILILAPIIEEFLFRGCLQNYFKRHLGTKAAILLTSLCFALFHYSGSQGLGNISLIASLFVFACFLGFTYERQGSLFASIALHVTFNLASSLRILLNPDSI